MREEPTILWRIVRLFGSYGLACILFLLLFLLTLFGTLDLRHASLHDVRTKYFDSLFFFPEAAPIPLPGATLVLGVLFVNLLVGGLLRMRRAWSRLGIFVIHIGIAFLLLSSLVEGLFSKKGYMAVWEGESGSMFESRDYWDVSVLEHLPDGRERSYTIPYDDLPGPGKSATFRAEGLPFDVELSGFLRNSRPRAAPAGSDSIDGIALSEMPPAMESEQNLPGITATIVAGDVRRQALLWGAQQAPYVTTIDGRIWALDLHPRRWPLPFTMTLRKFTRELHPGTMMASEYSSDVTRIEDNVAEDIHISMNNPMRHRGFIIYQSGFGPENAPEGSRMYSSFSVVENPADRGPWIAVTIIFVGLLGHMSYKLWMHTKAESGRRAS